MKAVAETLGVARSHLHDKVHRASKPRGPIASPKTTRCCRWSAAWSTSGRPMAIAASRRWPTGNWPGRASRSSTTSACSASCGRTACCSPATRVAGAAVSTTARSSSCAPTCAGARTASRSPAGTARSSGSPSSSMPMTARSSPGMPSSVAGISGSMVRDMMLEAVETRFAALRAPHAARMAHRQRQPLHRQGRRATSPWRSISCPASRPSRARSRTASPRASSKPSSATMFASTPCRMRSPRFGRSPDGSRTTTITILIPGSKCAPQGSSSEPKLNSRLSGQIGATPRSHNHSMRMRLARMISGG